MQKLSVVIVCRNESSMIERTINSVSAITDDIIVYDNGSADDTVKLAIKAGAKVTEGSWEGFGKTKRKATGLAKYDWVLSLDADEPVDDELKRSLLALDLANEALVYELKFRNFFGDRFLRHGEWGGDKHLRLFNRKFVNWNDAPVHEQLVIPAGISRKTLEGHILHLTAVDLKEYEKKLQGYAQLNAEKYHQQGKKTSWVRPGLSSAFSFIRNYIFKAGFLDGSAGFHCARMSAHYTFLKYAKLKELNRRGK